MASCAQQLWLEDVATIAVRDFVKVAQITGYNLDLRQISFEALPAPHKRTALPPSRMAVYSFWLADKVLKVGLASPNNDARFRFHHYSPGTGVSNLSKSIQANLLEFGLSEPPKSYRSWIEAHLARLDFLLPAAWGQPVGRLLEAYLHARWRPRFEGREWKGFSESLPEPNFHPPYGDSIETSLAE